MAEAFSASSLEERLWETTRINLLHKKEQEKETDAKFPAPPQRFSRHQAQTEPARQGCGTKRIDKIGGAPTGVDCPEARRHIRFQVARQSHALSMRFANTIRSMACLLTVKTVYEVLLADREKVVREPVNR